MSERVDYEAVRALVENLFRAEGVADEVASAMAEGFVGAEALGFRSHGVVRVAANLGWLRAGQTRKAGVPEVLRERPAIASWDAGSLPGHWAMRRALDHAMVRARELGAFTMTLRRCQHVACLAATLIPAIEARMIVLMMVSSPDEAFVSPFGGSERLFSNNPIAFTAPAPDWPILFDVSMAVTAGGQVARSASSGQQLPEAAIKTADGETSSDPAAFAEGGSVMPIGGLGHGHKGHALTLMTEVLTQALSGFGRSEAREESELNNIYLQVMEPSAFTAPEDYDREIDHLIHLVTGSRPDDPTQAVRVPGQRSWQARAEQMENGLVLDSGVLASLTPYIQDAGLRVPDTHN